MNPIYPAGEFATNPHISQTEGFGTHYIYIMSAIGYAEKFHKTFLYTPFQVMAHNYDNDPDFLQKKEKLINLIDHFPINRDIDFQKKCKIKGPCIFTDSESFKKIKKLFFAEKNKQDYFTDDFNIALHVRRRNQHDLFDPPPTKDLFYCNLIDQLRLEYASRSPRFHIYSQGNKEQFKVFEAQDVRLHINETVEDTFSAMTLADVLVTGPSYMSYCAGFLSNGKILYNQNQRPINWKSN